MEKPIPMINRLYYHGNEFVEGSMSKATRGM